MNKKILTALTVVGLAYATVGLTACARTWNEASANGGLIFSTNSDYIVRNDSGGRIMDVWVLNDSIVTPNEGAGYIFRDNAGNSVHLGGDCKIIRLNGNNDPEKLKYHEYHSEFEQKTYQEMYGNP